MQTRFGIDSPDEHFPHDQWHVGRPRANRTQDLICKQDRGAQSMDLPLQLQNKVCRMFVVDLGEARSGKWGAMWHGNLG
ncbi:hypothetical protein DWV00_12585 [Trinickia dinghuensis]|uniref:Uncharacterized protein n=1 Tax=Trinickia dinghuensis TaxID=2291023 RepID=A0A3D8JYT0_9BURK|nr:hypothetical protein DWV00_12585 [Trinickia dinghuensis]